MKNYPNYNPQINEQSAETQEEVISLDPIRGRGSRQRRKSDGTRKNGEPSKGKKNGKKSSSETASIWKAQTWRDFAKNPTLKLLTGVTFGCLAVYLTASFISYFSNSIIDQSTIVNTAIGTSGKVSNTGGEGGARIANFLIDGTFGLGSVVIIFWLFAMAFKMFDSRIRFKSVNFTIKCMVALISVSLIVGLLTIATDSVVNWGGLHGRYVNEFIVDFFGWTGAVILSVLSLSIFVILCLNDVIRWIIKMKKASDKRRAEAAKRKAEAKEKERLIEEMRRKELEEAAKAGEHHDESDEEVEEEEKGVTFTPESAEITDEADTEDITYGEINDYPQESEQEATQPGIAASAETTAGESAAAEAPEAESAEEDEAAGTDTMVVRKNHIGEGEGDAPSGDAQGHTRFPYKFPPYEILIDRKNTIEIDKEEQMENQDRIRKTLLDFGIPIVSIEATVGPTVTLYEIVPDKGVKIAKIRGLVDDIALSLAATGVRIIAPIPGKGTVGIEVANKVPQIVSMRTIIKSRAFQQNHFKLPIALGSTIGGEVYIADLAKTPHLLVAGATGQGKSVGLNAIITSLLYSRRPDELKFVMIDPKMVEFSLYTRIEKHYLAKLSGEEDPIITDISKVAATLNSLCVEMDNRYSLLKEASVRHIEEYNKKFNDHQLNPNRGHRYLPYIVVIVDEFSDLIMQAGREVEMPIARLGQKARAVGMHVIIATQRPSTNVITGLIKSNFPARIAFKTSSGIDSKTILDTTGAQYLIGRGDMLVSNNSEMLRVQCAFMDTPEVEELCDYISKQPYAQGAYILPEPKLGDSDGDGGHSEGGSLSNRDSLFEEVAHYVVQSGTASTSALQRRHSIGYNRAGKIMDQLEMAGIVSAAQGGKARSVLVDEMALEDILRSL